METLELPFGPWTKMFSGSWSGYAAALYENPDKLLLLTVFEKEGSAVKGVLLAMKQALVVDGDVSRFVASQRREVTVIEKTGPDFRARYMLLGASPRYIAFRQEEFTDAVGKMYDETLGAVRVAKEVLQTYDVRCKELKSADKAYAANLLEDPLTLFAFSGGIPVQQQQVASFAATFVRQEEIPLGVTKSGEVAEIGLGSLKSALVTGGKYEERIHAMHLLAEGALLNGVPVVVLDWSGALGGLALPNRSKADFERFKMRDVAPTGFPVKMLEPGDVHVDLQLVDAEAFRECAGMGTNEAAQIIIEGIKKAKAASLSDLINHVDSMQESKSITRYQISKAVRALEVLNKAYGAFIGGKNAATDFISSWSGQGKVTYVNFSKFPRQISALAAFCVLKTVCDFLKGGQSKGLRAVALIETPVVPRREGAVQASFLKLLGECAEASLGVAMQAEHDFELAGGFADAAELRIEIVEGEIVAKEKSKRPLRIVPRPALSSCAELQYKSQAAAG